MRFILRCTFILILVFFCIPQTTFAVTKTAVIGSSSFVGGCNSGGFVDKLKKTFTDKTFECFAQSGANSNFFVSEYTNKVQGKGFSDLILYAGLNGLSNQSGLINTQKDLTTIIQSAKQEGMKVIVMGAQPFKGYSSWTETWSNNIKSNNSWLAGKPLGIDAFIDIYSQVDKDNDAAIDPQFDSGDHLHLNKTGQELMFALLMQNVYGGYTPGPDAAGFDTSGLSQTSIGSTLTPVPTGYFPCSDQDPKTGSMIDAVFDSGEFTAETKPQIKCPEPQITIPGLQFGGVYIPEEGDADGGFSAYLPFIGDYILALYRYAIAAAGIVSILMIIFGGLQWMMSGGSSDGITSARKKIVGAIVGLFFAILSYTILYTLNPNLVQFRNLKIQYVQGQSLIAFDKGPLPYETSTISGNDAPKNLESSAYDDLFQKYASCTGVDWQVLKAVAYVESRFNASVVNSLGFIGLFQTKKSNCEDTLKKYGSKFVSMCNDLKNPEVSTMVGAGMLKSSVDKIKKKCPNINDESIFYFMYLGHHSGQGTLDVALSKTCSYTESPKYVHEYWNTRAGGKYADSTGKKRTAKDIAAEGNKAASKVMNLAKNLGATPTIKAIDKQKCPLLNTF